MVTRDEWLAFDNDCKYHRDDINKDIISEVRNHIDPTFMKTSADKKEFNRRYTKLMNYLKYQKNQQNSIKRQANIQ